VAGGTLTRILDGVAAEELDLGPAPGQPTTPLDVLLERVVANLCTAFGRITGEADPTEPLGLARLSCGVGVDGPHADVFAAVLEALHHFEAERDETVVGRPFPPAIRHLVHALVIARTPDVPHPLLPDAPPPTRAEAEA